MKISSNLKIYKQIFSISSKRNPETAPDFSRSKYTDQSARDRHL